MSEEKFDKDKQENTNEELKQENKTPAKEEVEKREPKVETAEESGNLHKSSENKVEEKEHHKHEEPKHEKQESEKKEEKKVSEQHEQKEKKKEKHEHKVRKHLNLSPRIRDYYVNNYKVLVFIALSVFLVLFVGMFIKSSITGELINKDISLKGGITFTIPFEQTQDLNLIKQQFISDFPKSDINFRILGTSSKSLSIETSDLNETQIIDVLSKFAYFRKPIEEKEYTVVTVGAVLGEGFFRETLKAILISFILMSLIVLIYFRSFIPSLFVSWNAFSDVAETFAILSIFGIKLSTASIAALLMLIGYSVDTNVLLTSRVLRAAHDKIVFLIFSSMRTGLAMTATTVITTALAYFISQSLVIKQIMFILTIGLLFDTFNTWVFNAPLLRWYLESKWKR